MANPRIKVDNALQAMLAVLELFTTQLSRDELDVLLQDLIRELEDRKDIVQHEIEELENPTPPTKNLNNLKPKK